MRARAIKNLCQLSEADLVAEISTGLSLILENSTRLLEDAKVLGREGCPQGFRILEAISEEEAAKFLILIDGIRCPQAELAAHLEKFWSHLARGIYARICNMRPADFREVSKIIARESAAYYLDGFEGVEYIFRNNILHSRESAMYVDYVETDVEGSYWLNPQNWISPVDPFEVEYEPAVLKLAKAITVVGMTSPKGLEVVAQIWRPIQMRPEYHSRELSQVIQKTLEGLAAGGFLCEGSKDAQQQLYQAWTFPLHSLEFSKEGSDNKKELRGIQARWSPSG